MATTGFWPVRGNLKSVLDYADNPDKTTDQKYLNDDLYQTLRYTSNDEKTDRKMYVAGINCSASYAYEEMSAVQKKFGNRGSVVAYHGYQSFPTGEVTPEEALEIGKETARRMWGSRYQVLVTVHLNTDNLHCHFVVNAVSFLDGMKFQNKIGDHLELRKISDRVCKERGLSILENSSFYDSRKKEYWPHEKGIKTHRDMLREDIEYCISVSHTFEQFTKQLRSLGYDIDSVRMTVKAKDWERGVRLSRLGFTRESITEQLLRNLDDQKVLMMWNTHLPYKPKKFPVENLIKQLEFSLEHAYDPATILVDTLFLLLITVFEFIFQTKDVILLSPDLRHEMKELKTYVSAFNLMQSEGIRTIPQLEAGIQGTEAQLHSLEAKRNKADNMRRRAHTPEEKEEAKKTRKEITKELTPLRQKLKLKKQILKDAPRIYQLLIQEHGLEKKARSRMLARERTR